MKSLRDNQDVTRHLDEAEKLTKDSPIQYYESIIYWLSDAKCKWILCVDKDEHEIGNRVSNSGYVNKVLEHPTKKLYGRPFAVRMCSNMWQVTFRGKGN